MDVESVAGYRTLIEHASDVFTVIDEDGVVQYCSPQTERVLGYGTEELVGETAFEYVHPDDREGVLAAFQAVVESSGGTREREAFRFRHADGSWVWLESTTTNPTDTAFDGYVLVSRDISERKARERELAAERERYATVVEESHDAIVIVQDEVTVFANPQAAALLGYEQSELVGEPFWQFVAEADRELVSERFRQRLDPAVEDPPSRYEVQMRTKAGETRVGELNVALIQYGGAEAALATVRDVTERTRAQAELERRTEELETLNRIVRHDIRNDMSPILGWGEMLEAHVDETGQDYLEKVLRSAEHVVELTDIAREYVETITGETDVEAKPIGLCSVIQTELDLRRESYPGATFVVDGEGPDVAVTADDMLGSVFRNLLNNAVQHNDTDAPTVTLSCAVDSAAETVVVRVADDGPGIPDERKERIFGKGETGLDSPGTGIGLYLVRTLVEGYGGAVRVEDNDPRGAVFVVELPLAE